MPFSFAGHSLDIDRRELRRGSELIPVEPQVFDLLVYLLRNRDRVVSKDDLIASVWGGRIVSDSTLTSSINAARKAVGDSGEEQRLIRTFARKGFRFVAEVGERADGPARIGASQHMDATVAPDSRSDSQEAVTSSPRRASIVIMPFVDRSGAARVPGGAADALAHDVITRLAKLRSLFVIAQGTVFALRERGIGPEEAGRMLNVDYIASGSVRRAGKRLVVEVELAETRINRIVRLGRFEEAAEWGVKAAARPNAFAHISAIAACSLALAGRLDEARAHVAAIRRTHPDYRVDYLLTAMQFPSDARGLFREGAKRIQFD